LLVLGISAFYHDSAAALVKDGKVIAAAQEERFTRKKNDSGFPEHAISYCLDHAGVGINEMDLIGFYDKPLLTFDRLLETYLTYAPAGLESFVRSIPVWVKEKLLQKTTLTNGLNGLDRGKLDVEKLLFGFHHHSHAASAFYPSPFDEAAIIVMDGVGEWATTTIGEGRGTKVNLLDEIRFPHSLGMLYSAFTYYLGFKVNEGEYKVMGLAPYGEPIFADRIRENLIDIKNDGSFRLRMEYFNYCTGLTMTNSKFHELFGGPPRNSAEPLAQRDMDLARSVQVITEEIVLAICEGAYQKTGLKNLCLAGGVALNCVANGRILRESSFDNIWIQPAAGDAGASLGVALALSHDVGETGRDRSLSSSDQMFGTYLGPSFEQADIETVLQSYNAIYRSVGDDELYEFVASSLADEKIVGWFQGRMEFGPRALGNRSILGDPRSERMQSMLNLKIKYRESFRPFAPAVLCEDVGEYFELEGESPYMLLVADVREERRHALEGDAIQAKGLDKLRIPRSDVPAVTHVDNSARVQTVSRSTNPRFHQLLEAFKAKSGCSVLVNTSFNVRDEPIVCTPEDAYRCFMATEMDILIVGNTILIKEEQ
jgi:carbamoyltransferase